MKPADYSLYYKCFFVLFFTQDDSVPYSFFVNESEITGSLKETLETQTLETEKVVEIVYQPQAVFKVRAVTRCTSTIPGRDNIIYFYLKLFQFSLFTSIKSMSCYVCKGL